VHFNSGCLSFGVSACDSIQGANHKLTITSHAHGEALLQPAVLTPVAVVFGDLAVFAAPALVAQLLPY